MINETVFYQKVNERRVQGSEACRDVFEALGVLYVNSAVNWAEALKIDGIPVK